MTTELETPPLNESEVDKNDSKDEEETGQNDAAAYSDLIDTLTDETKPMIHLAQHFDFERKVLIFGNINDAGIFLINSDKEFVSAENLENSHQLIGIPSGQVSVKVIIDIRK